VAISVDTMARVHRRMGGASTWWPHRTNWHDGLALLQRTLCCSNADKNGAEYLSQQRSSAKGTVPAAPLVVVRWMPSTSSALQPSNTVLQYDACSSPTSGYCTVRITLVEAVLILPVAWASACTGGSRNSDRSYQHRNRARFGSLWKAERDCLNICILWSAKTNFALRCEKMA
jgi:hypothetical protein